MKVLFIILALAPFLAAYGSDADAERETKKLLSREIVLVREFADRNMLTSALKYVTLCDSEVNLSWCEGYFSAVYVSIESNGSEICAPRHKMSKKVIFESAWAIVKESLIRLPENAKVKFYDSTVSALTQPDNCTN
ncbi:MAG: hypothetical protein ACJAS1_004730 [Oleiphilaceae bacterium]|jgi:hypothetical protein